MPILAAHDLVFEFPGDIRALDRLSLDIPRGRRLALLGPNGSGKSTFLLHLNGTLKPDSGQVSLEGRPVSYNRAGLNDWRRRVALVLQDADDQLFASTVFEDVSFGPLNLGLTESEAVDRVEEALEALHLTELADRPPHMLSGGQKKRAAIAGAVAMRPDVLLLDEPTAGLDPLATDQLVSLLLSLSAKGMTLIFSTHDIDLALRLAEDVALFDHGRLLARGTATSILSDRLLLNKIGLRPPAVLDLALRARELGLHDLPTEAILSREDFERLMQTWKTR